MPPNLVNENPPSNKTWTEKSVQDNTGIHNFQSHVFENKRIYNNVLDAIGNIPLIKLNKIPKEYGIECNVYVKPEYLNAGGSIKDRIAIKMIDLAEEEGILKPGMTLIEPTSGNTGIGLALAATIKGYKCIICMPQKMSKEKEVIIKALGATMIRTPTEVPKDSPESYVSVAARLGKEIKGGAFLNQYNNAGNPMAHYETTATEIIDSLNGNVDMVVAGVGTGGTISGLAKKIKKDVPKAIIVGVDPEGSLISDPNGKVHGYLIEGIGHDYIPNVCDVSVVDEWVKTNDKNSFIMARDLIKKEGILCGGSSGANVWGALQAAKKLKKGQNCVVILPDGIRNYYTRFCDDNWLIKNHLIDKIDTIPIISIDNNLFENNIQYDPTKKPSEKWKYPLSEPSFNPIKSKVMNSILEAIGHTPLIRLNKLPKELGIEAEVLVKCEYFNASGSIKDRVALRMIEAAEENGSLKAGMTIIEPTTDSLGIGLAFVSAVKGYHCIIVTTNNISKEKEIILKTLGAEVIKTSIENEITSTKSYIDMAIKLHKKIPNSIILDQYTNFANTQAHYSLTAEEILYSCQNKIDMVVVGACTGGSITGIGKKIKEKIPYCQIVGTDLEGSVFSDSKNKETFSTEIEDIGCNFIPAIFDQNVVDIWMKVNDKNSFETANKLIRKEGLLCGGASGACTWAGLECAKKLKKGQRIVIILPDSVNNYISKFVDPEWMKKRNYETCE
ncbi:Cystathionine beta-synthase [Strongyloides ratti]|uniref:cystathionine beta-synthase n=1 Tax=Strongyloides ratti TaxID=34506 RepID=A0A090L5J2_STRRB|nr:Cystathionine beta-synthase [Strongyloides ratti]CEF64997.1 Cystathionine beta-synthase [Strongyloides ratti]